jgi:hypothetical protein
VPLSDMALDIIREQIAENEALVKRKGAAMDIRRARRSYGHRRARRSESRGTMQMGN